MPPQSPDQNQAPAPTLPSPEMPPVAPTNPVEPVVPPPQKSRKKLFIILAIILVAVLSGGAYALFSGGDSNTDNTSQSTQPQDSDDQTVTQAADTPETCPDGFTQFEGNNIGLHFCYPQSWGNASLESGVFEAMGNLKRGNDKKIVFSGNADTVATLKSKDWEPDSATGLCWPNYYSSIAEAKGTRSSSSEDIYVDNENQLAFLGSSVGYCGGDVVYLSYVVKLDNPAYEAVTFNQVGPQFGPEYYTDGYVDESKIGDLSLVFKKDDSRFVVLQQVAHTVRGKE